MVIRGSVPTGLEGNFGLGSGVKFCASGSASSPFVLGGLRSDNVCAGVCSSLPAPAVPALLSRFVASTEALGCRSASEACFGSSASPRATIVSPSCLMFCVESCSDDSFSLGCSNVPESSPSCDILRRLLGRSSDNSDASLSPLPSVARFAAASN
jgi:hypothetical protein